VLGSGRLTWMDEGEWVKDDKRRTKRGDQYHSFLFEANRSKLTHHIGICTVHPSIKKNGQDVRERRSNSLTSCSVHPLTVLSAC
jgi:hypothetical protein